MMNLNNLFDVALQIAAQPRADGILVLAMLRRLGYPINDSMLAARECVRAGVCL